MECIFSKYNIFFINKKKIGLFLKVIINEGNFHFYFTVTPILSPLTRSLVFIVIIKKKVTKMKLSKINFHSKKEISYFF